MWRMLLPVFVVAALGAVAMYYANEVYGPIPIWMMVFIALSGVALVGGMPFILGRSKKK
jgi:RsiW-degrading membrane proteinase PrsW (M82 family)